MEENACSCGQYRRGTISGFLKLSFAGLGTNFQESLSGVQALRIAFT
jgi:hypothetical protein